MSKALSSNYIADGRYLKACQTGALACSTGNFGLISCNTESHICATYFKYTTAPRNGVK